MEKSSAARRASAAAARLSSRTRWAWPYSARTGAKAPKVSVSTTSQPTSKNDRWSPVDHVGAGDHQELVAPLQIGTPEVVGGQVGQLQIGAHGAVEDDDPLGDGVPGMRRNARGSRWNKATAAQPAPCRPKAPSRLASARRARVITDAPPSAFGRKPTSFSIEPVPTGRARARIYTKTGDDGTTGLLYGGRVAKDSPVMQVNGAVDEAQAALGLARAECAEPKLELDTLLTGLERELYVLMAEVATAAGQPVEALAGKTLVTEEMVDALERRIDDLIGRFDMPADFVIPGANRASAGLDLARTIVRRAERLSWPIPVDGSLAGRYLNRLSDLLWAMARWAEGDEHLLARVQPRDPAPVGTVTSRHVRAPTPSPTPKRWACPSSAAATPHGRPSVRCAPWMAVLGSAIEVDRAWSERHGFNGKVGQVAWWPPRSSPDGAITAPEVVLVGCGRPPR